MTKMRGKWKQHHNVTGGKNPSHYHAIQTAYHRLHATDKQEYINDHWVVSLYLVSLGKHAPSPGRPYHLCSTAGTTQPFAHFQSNTTTLTNIKTNTAKLVP